MRYYLTKYLKSVNYGKDQETKDIHSCPVIEKTTSSIASAFQDPRSQSHELAQSGRAMLVQNSESQFSGRPKQEEINSNIIKKATLAPQNSQKACEPVLLVRMSL